mmetsp:Transcript_28554/g.80457  ORF Transcript_28554/g.80457 Transcript_28554/m.80457 type:complete len:220 (-) Transcript_28554:2183-2842(-)
MIFHGRQPQRSRQLDAFVVDEHGFFGLHDGVVAHWRRPAFSLADGIGRHQSQLVAQLLVAVIHAFECLCRYTSVQPKVKKVTLFGLLDLFRQLLRLGLPALQDDIDVVVRDRGFFRPKDGVGSKSHRGHHLVFGYLVFLLESTLLHHHRIQLQLLLRSFDDLFFDGIFADQAVDADGLLLPQSMAAILRLQILLRVPVAVVEDARIGGLQVDPQPAGSR